WAARGLGKEEDALLDRGPYRPDIPFQDPVLEHRGDELADPEVGTPRPFAEPGGDIGATLGAGLLLEVAGFAVGLLPVGGYVGARLDGVEPHGHPPLDGLG